MTEQMYNDLVRVHKSCGAPLPKNASEEMVNFFEIFEQSIRKKINLTQEQTVGCIAQSLQNQSLLQFNRVLKESDRIKVKYRAEIEMYIDNLRQNPQKNATDKIRHNFLNNKLIAFCVIIVGIIVVISSFAAAIENISKLALNFIK